MTEDHRAAIGIRTLGLPTSGFAGLLSQIQRDAYRRLAWLGWLAGGALAFRLSSSVFLELDLGHFLWPALVVLPLVLILAVLCRRSRLPVEWFPSVAVCFEILVALALGTQLLDWQNTLGSSGWPLAAIPSVGVWVILFASVIPLPPSQHLLGAVLSGSAVPLAFFLSLTLYEVPSTVGPEENLRVFLQLMVATGISIAVAYIGARRIYGLSVRLTEARHMGNYQLVEKLGEGGMGEVWRAKHHLLMRPAAVKLIRSDGIGPAYEVQLQRFEREIQATVSLHSPHTIEVYDYGTTEDGTFYYVMELLDGIDLEELVREYGPQPPERVVHILRQTCHSLGEAHGAGLVHRDIKPANIFICRHGRELDFVKVLDFGMVKDHLGEAGLTQMGTFAGTPQYAAPEMAEGLLDEIDPRSDLYSLGCVAYWLLTGRTVFEAESAMKTLMKHINEKPAPPSQRVEGVPADLERLILRCLAKDRDDRPSSTDELDQGLSALNMALDWTEERATLWWEMHRASIGQS